LGCCRFPDSRTAWITKGYGMALSWLSDEAWAAIEPHLPKNQPGARQVDDRR